MSLKECDFLWRKLGEHLNNALIAIILIFTAEKVIQMTYLLWSRTILIQTARKQLKLLVISPQGSVL